MGSAFAGQDVLLHPKPRGIIQFIGAFVFGSVPACAYRSLLLELHSRGFSLVLHRFPLNPLQFNHWEVALGLLERARRIRSQIASGAAFPVRASPEAASPITVSPIKSSSLQASIDRDFYLDPSNTCWLGHSLGCKFILLLEILSNEENRRDALLRRRLPAKDVDFILGRLNTADAVASVLGQGGLSPVIRNQPSILIAPEIGNTVRFLRSDFQVSNGRARPDKGQSEALILDSSDLFHLTRVISYDWDGIAADDVKFLGSVLLQRGAPAPVEEHLSGWHLEPLSARVGDLADRIEAGFLQLRLQPGAPRTPVAPSSTPRTE